MSVHFQSTVAVLILQIAHAWAVDREEVTGKTVSCGSENCSHSVKLRFQYVALFIFRLALFPHGHVLDIKKLIILFTPRAKCIRCTHTRTHTHTQTHARARAHTHIRKIFVSERVHTYRLHGKVIGPPSYLLNTVYLQNSVDRSYAVSASYSNDLVHLTGGCCSPNLWWSRFLKHEFLRILGVRRHRRL